VRICGVVGAALVTVLLATAGTTSPSSAWAGGTIGTIKDQTSRVLDPKGPIVTCSTGVAAAPALPQVKTRFVTGLLDPFGVAFAPSGKQAFVDSLFTPARTAANPVVLRDDSGISVYSVTASGMTQQRVGTFSKGSLVGMALSPSGRILAAANTSGASIFSVSRMERLKSAPSSWLLGSFVSKGQGAIETAFSPDSDYVFVTLESSDQVAVFNLKKAERNGFEPSDLIGYVPLGIAPVGMAISPNGRDLYATSEAVTPTGEEGTLSTIDLRRAEHDPSRSLVSTVWAGCSPVRVVATRSDVYVSARGSDDLIAFSAADLVLNPTTAKIGQVQVGEAPVGLALVQQDKRIVVADSNRFSVGVAPSNLAVVSTSNDGSLRLLGYIGAGGFPRDMAVSPNGKVLIVSDFDSGDVEEIGVSTLP
jgi:DNA-binding beta-propeller fold protein YncE